MGGSDEVSELSFEAALARLETIVRQLEGGDAPLEASIELYEEGERLKRQCEAKLASASARIEKIQVGAAGQATGTVQFDAD